MKTKLLWIIFLPFIFITSNCQQMKDKRQDNKVKTEVKELGDNPKVNVKVNREYDDNGNLVRYDSTYTSFYTDFKGDSSDFEDFYAQFYPHFQEFSPAIMEDFFNEMFFVDSLKGYDFYKNDFFSKRFELNQEYFLRLFDEMDSIKNAFFSDLPQPKMPNKQ